MSITTDTPVKIETAIVELDEPLARGTGHITTLTLRRPRAGALRGVSLMDLMNMNVSALQVVLPRITEPTLTQHDVAAMDPADLVRCGIEVSLFLAQKEDRALASPGK